MDEQQQQNQQQRLQALVAPVHVQHRQPGVEVHHFSVRGAHNKMVVVYLEQGFFVKFGGRSPHDNNEEIIQIGKYSLQNPNMPPYSIHYPRRMFQWMLDALREINEANDWSHKSFIFDVTYSIDTSIARLGDNDDVRVVRFQRRAYLNETNGQMIPTIGINMPELLVESMLEGFDYASTHIVF